MSKSKRTQERYRKQNKDQTSLTTHFGFTITKSASAVKVSESSRACGLGSRTRSASVLSDPSTDREGDQENPSESESGLADVQEDVGEIASDSEEVGFDEQEIYESDLEEAI